MRSKKSKCEHLNAETRVISGQSVVVCKDCASHVDPSAFEIPVPTTPKPVPVAGKDGEVVFQGKVGKPIDIPGVGAPFVPVFGLKSGDDITIIRKS